MSDSLSQAASAYRRQKPAEVVPIIRLQPAPAPLRRHAARAAVLLLTGSLIVGSIFSIQNVNGAEPRESATSQPLPPVAAVSVPVVEAKNTPPDSDGIALPIEEIALNESQALSETAMQITGTQALNDAPSRSTETPVIVNESTPPSSTQLLKEAREKLEANNENAALERYNAVLAMDKTNAEALAGKLFIIGQSEKPTALNEVRQIAADYPRSATAQNALGRLLFKQGDQAGAIAALQRAVELDAGHAEYRLALAVLYDRMGQKTEALAQYQGVPTALLPASARKRMEYLTLVAQP